MNLKSGSCYLPRPKAGIPLGQDAHFIWDEKNTIGVADGVGGWAKDGIDSGIYARELISNSIAAIKDRFSGSEVVVNPEEVLSDAYSKTKAEGASTACFMTLKDNAVHAVNVGDSRFMIIRRGKTVYKSPVQQSRFNCPYQLGTESRKPSSAKVIKVGVEIGDVIVAGTDGLFDNLFTADIELLLASLLGDDHGVEPYELASKIAELALSKSYEANTVSPFELASKNSGSPENHHTGGKKDDIMVIVSFVLPSSSSLADDQIQIKVPSDDQIQIKVPVMASSSSLADDQIQIKVPSDDQIQIKVPVMASSSSLGDDQIQIKVTIKRKLWGSSTTTWIWTTIRKQWKKPRRLALCGLGK